MNTCSCGAGVAPGYQFCYACDPMGKGDYSTRSYTQADVGRTESVPPTPHCRQKMGAYTCTRMVGHAGTHVAHFSVKGGGQPGRIIAVSRADEIPTREEIEKRVDEHREVIQRAIGAVDNPLTQKLKIQKQVAERREVLKRRDDYEELATLSRIRDDGGRNLSADELAKLAGPAPKLKLKLHDGETEYFADENPTRASVEFEHFTRLLAIKKVADRMFRFLAGLDLSMNTVAVQREMLKIVHEAGPILNKKTGDK